MALEGQRWPACPQEILRPLTSWCARAPPQGILMGSLLWATHVEVKSKRSNVRHCSVASCRRGLSYPPDGCSLAGRIMVIGAEFTGRAALQRRAIYRQLPKLDQSHQDYEHGRSLNYYPDFTNKN